MGHRGSADHPPAGARDTSDYTRSEVRPGGYDAAVIRIPLHRPSRRPLFALLAAVAVVTSACGDDGEGGDGGDGEVGPGLPFPGFRAGSRLVPVGWRAGGEPLLREGWWDTELDSPCFFRLAADGRWRCLPDPVDQLLLPVRGDAACAGEPLFVDISDCGSTPRWATVGSGGADCRGGFADALALAPGPDDAPLYEGTEATCAPYEGPVESVSSVEATVDPATLVGAEVRVLDLPGPVDLRVLVADDGAAQVQRPQLEDGTPCGPQVGLDGQLRCVPTSLAFRIDGWFADPACEAPVAQAPRGLDGCPGPALVRSPEGGGAAFFAVGEVVDGSVYRRDGDGCVEVRTPPFVAYRVGEPVPPATFPPLERGVVLPSLDATVGVAGLLSRGTLLLALQAATASGTPCLLLRDGVEGPTVCLAGAVADELTWFADGDCTRPLAAARPDETPPDLVFQASPVSTCTWPAARVLESLRRVTASWAGGVWGRSEGVCVALGPADDLAFFETEPAATDDLPGVEPLPAGR